VQVFAEILKRPIQIQGKEIVIVPDLVGPVPISEQHQYVESAAATNTCPTIHIRESDIEEMRERYEGVPVYGMWHILIHSGLVSVKRTLQVVPVGEDNGYYIHCDLGRAEYSGIYESGFFAADASFSLDEALELNPTVDQLLIPHQEAKLAAELSQERQIMQRQAWSTMVLVMVAIIALAFGINVGLGKFYDLQQHRIQSQAQELAHVRSNVDQLRTTRLTEVPNDEITIDHIAALWSLDPDFHTDNSQSFQNNEMVFTLGDLEDDPKSKLSWLISKYNPRGSWQVTMKVKG